MIEAYARWVVRWRWLMLILPIVLVLLAASGGKNLHFNNDYRAFFDGDNPQLLSFENLQDTYVKNDNVLISVTPAEGEVFTPEVMSVIKDLTEQAWQTPFSTRVDSLTNYQHTYAEGDDLIVEDLIYEPEALSVEEYQSVKQIAINEPLLVNRLISPDARHTAVNITVEMPAKDPAVEVPEVVSFVRGMVDEAKAAHPELEFHITGIVMMNNAFQETAQMDIKTLVPMAFLGILLMLVLLLRDATSVVVTFLTILFSILAAMGLWGHLNGELTTPTMSAPTIILTLAVADCVHLLVTWQQQRRKGKDKKQAMEESVRINFTPVFLTSVTTAIGFLTLNFSDAPPFGALGNISAMGVVVAWLLSITFLPAAMCVLPSFAPKAKPEGKSGLMEKFSEWVIAKRNPLLWGMLAIILFFSAFLPKNELNDVFVKYFDESIDFRVDTDYVADNLTGIYFVDFSLEAGESGGISNPDFLESMDKLVDWLRQQPEVIHVSTITDVFKRLNKNMHADNQDYYRLPDDRNLAAQYLLLYEMSLPYGLDLNNQINVDKSSTRLSVTMQTLSSNEVIMLEDRIRSWMENNEPQLLTTGASPTIMFAHIGKTNVKSMLLGTSIALVLISLILVVALRSWRYGLISLMPNLFPAMVGFGVWGLLVGQVGLSLSVVAAMTLGIVVDDTVHFLSKYLRARKEQNLSAEDAVRYAFSNVGVAMWVTTLALVVGFLVLSTSGFELNAGMGLMTAIVITIALIIDFLFLPPLLMKLEEKKS